MEIKLYYNELLLLKTFKERNLINIWFNIKIHELSRELDISEQGILRNLKKLEYKGFLDREMKPPIPGTYSDKHKRNFHRLTEKAINLVITDLGTKPPEPLYTREDYSSPPCDMTPLSRDYYEYASNYDNDDSNIKIVGDNVLLFKSKAANSRS